MPVGFIVRLEPIHAFGNKRHISCGQPMYLVVESSAFSKEGARCEKTNWALFALTDCSHINPFSIDA
jgi:hypothetical protein